MIRDAVLPLLVGLVLWIGFDLLSTARTQRDNALYELAGLREAARISGERLAARDDIDLTRTLELNHERAENDVLRRAVDDGRQRLRVKATCSSPVPANPGAGSLVDAATAELTTDARADYFTLKDQLVLNRQMILGLQDHIRRICLR